MIYAIEALGLSFIKFGRTQNIEHRLTSLQIGCPVQLAVLATADWPNESEYVIHQLLADRRGLGEWFGVCDPVTRIVNQMLQGHYTEFMEDVVEYASSPNSRLKYWRYSPLRWSTTHTSVNT